MAFRNLWSLWSVDNYERLICNAIEVLNIYISEIYVSDTASI